MTDTTLKPNTLKTVFRNASNSLNDIEQQIKQLEAQRSNILTMLRTVINTLKSLQKDNPSSILKDLDIPSSLRFENVSVADAIELMLNEFGDLNRPEIVEKLREAKFPMSEKNARIVIANAITRDAKKRFKVLKDGKVRLEEKTLKEIQELGN